MDVNLGLAINSFKEAFKIYTFDKFPQDYAMTQMNLGVAYFGLSGASDKDVDLESAIVCFKEARKVFAKQALP